MIDLISNIKLCKINCNDAKVRAHFQEARPLPPILEFSSDAAILRVPSDDEDSAETVPSSALGLQWDTLEDSLRAKGALRDKKFAKRGHLSHTMAQCDPEGINSHMMLDTKLI